MEYENRYKPLWYQVTLLLVYGAVIVFTVLVNNPYLYSSIPYGEALSGKKDNSNIPLPLRVATPDEQNASLISLPDGLFNWNKNASDPMEKVTRDRRYRENMMTPLFVELEKPPKIYHWSIHEDMIVALSIDGKAYGIHPEGQLKWTLEIAESMAGPFHKEMSLSSTYLYLSHPAGRILAVEKMTGRIHWSLKSKGEILSGPVLMGDALFFVEKSLTVKKKTAVSTSQLIHLQASTGKETLRSNDLELSGTVSSSLNLEEKVLYLNSEQRLVAMDLKSLKTKWSTPFENPPSIGAAVITKDQALISLKVGQLLSLSLNNGKKNWELELNHALSATAAYIPIYNRASIITDDTYQHVVDLDSGKRVWRFNLNNENKVSTSWTTRLRGQFIQELNMKWRYKGWTLWSPCVSRRICIYNPENGNIIGRVMLKGQLASLPVYRKEGFKVLVEKESGYALVDFVERKTKPQPKTQEPGPTDSEG